VVWGRGEPAGGVEAGRVGTQVGTAVQDVGPEDDHAAGRKDSARQGDWAGTDPWEDPGGRVEAQGFPDHAGGQVAVVGSGLTVALDEVADLGARSRS
jgi:hypothetical protein